MPLPLIDQNATTVACMPQKYSPASDDIVNAQADTWLAAGEIPVTQRQRGDRTQQYWLQTKMGTGVLASTTEPSKNF